MRFGAVCLSMMLLGAAQHAARAQEIVPDGEKSFRTQCSTCHTLKAADGTRQGPTLEKVYGRKIGSIEGYAYTPGYRESGAVWGDENLDAYLTNPGKMFPGSTMSYRQSKPEIRQAIIAYLKAQS